MSGIIGLSPSVSGEATIALSKSTTERIWNTVPDAGDNVATLHAHTLLAMDGVSSSATVETSLFPAWSTCAWYELEGRMVIDWSTSTRGDNGEYPSHCDKGLVPEMSTHIDCSVSHSWDFNKGFGCPPYCLLFIVLILPTTIIESSSITRGQDLLNHQPFLFLIILFIFSS